MAGVSYRSVLFLIKFLFIVEIVLFVCSCMLVHARSCSFLVRDVGALGLDGVLEVSSVMVIMAEMVIKVAMVNVVMMVIVMVAMVVMLVMTKKMLKSNHDNVL